MNARSTGRAAVLLLVLAFFYVGLKFLPRLGFEYDEVVFIQSLFRPAQSFFAAHLFHHSIPLMQMSYAGSLKTWAYAWILQLSSPDAVSVRVPALLLASLTIILIGAVVQHLASPRSAVFTCALLATDLNFLLASVFDWGPVVLQNFLLAVALYFALVYSKKTIGISIAAFVCGLALWDKAIFFWIFSSLIFSGALFGLRVLRRELTPGRLGLATVALLVGAAPIVVYNLEHHSQTFTANAKFSFADVGPKFTFLRIAVNNQAFKNFFVDESMMAAPTTSAKSQGALYSLGLRSHGCSSWRSGLFVFLLLGGVVLARSGKRRLILWLEAAVILAWMQAAITRDAGGFVHHVVIFYPVIFIALGICADEIARRLKGWGSPFLVATGLLICGLGLTVINAQYTDFQRFSPSTFWTDADRVLAQYLAVHKDRRILIGDWGIATQADVRTRGVLSLEEISFILKDGVVTGEQIQDWTKAKSLIVMHTAEHTMFPGQNGKLATLAKAYGLAIAPVKIISDQGGHPMFEIDELSAQGASRVPAPH